MRVKIWGARGSVPAPGPETARYGGNTTCVQVTLDDGTIIVLDGGTGLRKLGLRIGNGHGPIRILLTHLHLDHIQGLMFFPPLFREENEVIIWGPASPEGSLEERIGRYISAPLSPVEIRELPCQLSFRDAPTSKWQIGSATIEAASIAHRGPTLGYRVTQGEESICFIPDHEPGLGADLQTLEPEWISGFDLARGASLLIHDCQYTNDEYPDHIGWGHSALEHTLDFAARTEPERLMLFHHDPLHDDSFLDRFCDQAQERWCELGGSAAAIGMAVENTELTVGAARVPGP